jgi:hypothetical protein
VIIGKYEGGCFLVIGAHSGESAEQDDMASHRGRLGDVLEGEWKGGNDCESLETA